MNRQIQRQTGMSRKDVALCGPEVACMFNLVPGLYSVQVIGYY